MIMPMNARHSHKRHRVTLRGVQKYCSGDDDGNAEHKPVQVRQEQHLNAHATNVKA